MTLGKKNGHRLYRWVLVGGLALASCTPQTKEDEAVTTTAEAPAAQPSNGIDDAPFAITVPQGFDVKSLNLPEDDTKNPLKQVERLSMAHVVQDPWTKLDRQYRELLLVQEDEPYHFILQQQAANVMLRNHLFGHYYQDPNNPQLQEAIGFYTRQLLQAKSEDAELVYKCLRALKDSWPNEQIKQVAMATAARVQARPITSVADTTGRAKYKLTYGKALTKMAEKL
ncbi:hypothetical protein GU926_13975 [Nibribacter ruber]|uniref:Uncharacterized protein n=1 Tax=Nibribacter ruber TaxID=2698458 RepID=A0A6P1P254_9BACT|nr:hypothetical protein [Nibribacter ruber]QHL88477.1 hypothetical protein GU926_13975 [Nibribacter ruber]